MSSTEIEVTIDEDGEATIDVTGTVGDECTKYTDSIVKALGGKVTSDTKKPEYYQGVNSKVRSKG